MGQQDTTEAKIAAKHVTKITGQPTDRDLTLLKKELVKIAGKEATSLGGGKHGHIGILMKEADYKAISNGGVEFAIPSHPGHHPTTLSTATGTREKQLLKHKAELTTYETCQGVISGIKELIAGAVSTEWLEEINDDILEFQNVTCLEMLEHLEARGGDVDYIDIQEMRKERDAPWNTNEHIVTYFSGVQGAVKRLKKAGVTSDEVELLANALFSIKQSGEMEHALQEWDKKAKADQTWEKAKTYFSKEYANRRKHKTIEAKQAGYGSANQIGEEELIEEVTKELLQQAKSSESNELREIIDQQKKMIEANQKLMQQLMQSCMQAGNNNSGNRNTNTEGGNQGGGERKSMYADWQITKTTDMIMKDDKPWWWCPNHNKGKGLYVRHKPENHSKWQESLAGNGRRYTDSE